MIERNPGETDSELISRLKNHCAALEGIIRDTLWMARRYAHGRHSYAVGMYNAAARAALNLGIAGKESDGSVFAIDGGLLDGVGSPGMSGLSQDEYDSAVEGLNRVGITPVPSKFHVATKDQMF